MTNTNVHTTKDCTYMQGEIVKNIASVGDSIKSLTELYVTLKSRAIRPKIINPMSSGIPNNDFISGDIVNPVNIHEASGIRILTQEFDEIPELIESLIDLNKKLLSAITT